MPDGAQEDLENATVLLVGVGALGTALAETLVRAGIGRLVLVDRDIVELSNLQRQRLFTEADVDRPKAIAAAEHLAEINGRVDLHPVVADFGENEYEALPHRPDLILDGTDNFATRYLINDLAMRDHTPWIYGGVVGTKGTAMAILPGLTPCLRCLMPEAPATGETETCETAGVLEPAVAGVTSFQAAEALKILTRQLDAVTRGILILDVWDHQHAVRMPEAGPAAHCVVCRGEAFPALGQDWAASVTLCGRDAVQVRPRGATSIDLFVLGQNLAAVAEQVEHTEPMLRFSVDGCRFSVFPDGRALLFGVADADRARVLYDRYVGG